MGRKTLTLRPSNLNNIKEQKHEPEKPNFNLLLYCNTHDNSRCVLAWIHGKKTLFPSHRSFNGNHTQLDRSRHFLSTIYRWCHVFCGTPYFKIKHFSLKCMDHGRTLRIIGLCHLRSHQSSHA